MAREKVSEGGLLIDSMRDFRHSISTRNACTSEVRRLTLLSGVVMLK